MSLADWKPMTRPVSHAYHHRSSHTDLIARVNDCDHVLMNAGSSVVEEKAAEDLPVPSVYPAEAAVLVVPEAQWAQ